MRKIHSSPLILSFIIGVFSFCVLKILQLEIEIKTEEEKLDFLNVINKELAPLEIEIIDNEQ